MSVPVHACTFAWWVGGCSLETQSFKGDKRSVECFYLPRDIFIEDLGSRKGAGVSLALSRTEVS